MLTLTNSTIPEQLLHLPQPPKQLFINGAPLDLWLNRPKVAIVGSRKVSMYGQQVTKQLAGGLAREGVVILSGLALGVDAIAHQAALDSGGTTVAVLPGPVERVYPSGHRGLAERIITKGGSLISEHPPNTAIFKYSFIARNRLIAALADVLLITEAALKSGSLHTARFALEQGTTVMAVPGNITQSGSVGTNNLIKSGALPVTDVGDVLLALGIERQGQIHTKTEDYTDISPDERSVLRCIQEGCNDQSELIIKTKLSAAELGATLTSLEINGLISPLGSGRWAVRTH